MTMDRFNAHGLFCARPDGGHSLLHPDCDPEIAPAFCAALASLSGMLDGCETQDDLDEAVRHGVTLLSIGTINPAELHAEVRAVLDEVGAWAEAVNARLQEIAESN
jgi:hypothetical protein